ncbi:MAG: hypothetical protein ACE5NM_00270 [Sedimentisphaerales bacterium]
MSKANNNGKSGADILRATDIVPPYSKKSNHEDNSRELKSRSKNNSLPQKKHEVPRFDLAEEILAEQRKITAIRRKAPSKTSQASSQKQQVQSIGYATPQPLPMLSEQQQIITEIVARDIKNLTK